MACPTCGGPSSSGSGAKSPGVAGRPLTYGKFSIRPISESAGYTISNTEPDVITRVNDQFLKAHELPPNLQPRSRALAKNKNDNISRGWKKPKDGRR